MRGHRPTGPRPARAGCYAFDTMASSDGAAGHGPAPPVPPGELEAAAARFVPLRLLELLGVHDISQLRLGASTERKMTILFSDICGFTALCESMRPEETFSFINSFLEAMEPVVTAHGGYVDKYIGDAIMALFPDRADDAADAGVAMLGALERFNASRGRDDRHAIRVGVGLNTGVVMLGIVGGPDRLEGPWSATRSTSPRASRGSRGSTAHPSSAASGRSIPSPRPAAIRRGTSTGSG